jgi:SAM-dependent methyltransferase
MKEETINPSKKQEALERLRPHFDRAQSFTGWDLSAIKRRELEPGPPWDYALLVRQLAQGKSSVLDMGTGGGELLARMRGELPPRVLATEPWSVNAPVAKRRLAPLSVDVVRCWSTRLPFRAAGFDLVINRHEELEPADVARVLRRGGQVVTQQVGGSEWQELRKFFPRMSDFGNLRNVYAEGFEMEGLKITTNLEHDHRVAYSSLEDLVYMLALMPWTIPKFNLEEDIEALLALESECTSEKGLVLTESRFLISAERPELERNVNAQHRFPKSQVPLDFDRSKICR